LNYNANNSHKYKQKAIYRKTAAIGMAPLEAEETATHNLVMKQTMTNIQCVQQPVQQRVLSSNALQEMTLE